MSIANHNLIASFPDERGATSSRGAMQRHAPPIPPMRPRAQSYTDEGPMRQPPPIPPMRPRAQSYTDEGLGPRLNGEVPASRQRVPSVEELPPMRAQAVTVEDATLDDVRQSAKVKRIAKKDTIREHDDEDTPQTLRRLPLRATLSS
jgi:hypothetical protein